jgi:serine/threonine protein kinase
LDEYELGEVLGEGGFGKVVLGRQIATKRKVAIKFMDISE